MVRRVLLLAAIGAAVGITFAPAAGFPFLNWDDGLAIVGNAGLDFPGVARWAVTTSLMEHYQPVSWLVWAVIKAVSGVDARVFHLANIALHVVCVWLVWAVARAVFAGALRSATPAALDAGATAAALLYGLHPLRVEVVAWVSALPYTVALALLLAATLAWLRASSLRRQSSLWLALGLYAASLAARPLALGFPIVVAVLDIWLYGRSVRESARRAVPFAVLAAIAAVAEIAARAPGANPTPWLDRVQSAASAPFVYLWHTAAPIGLTPLDVLPLRPVGDPVIAAAAIAAVLAVSIAAWRCRHRTPGASVAWVSYLALLAPATGLMPSGLQATADRYSYFPATVVAVAIAGAAVSWSAKRRERAAIAAAALAAAALACVVLSRATLQPWSSSVSLWTRAVSLDPSNDVGLYNLALALSAEGRADEAAARYRDVLAIVPAHADARANLDRLDAARLEREGNELAARGELAVAAERYAEAIARDPQRTHSHAARGVALATLGQSASAIPELRAALQQGERDPAVANALGVLLLQSGQTGEARAVLETALAAHPSDVGLAHNLARLLVTSANTPRADVERALRLARAVVDATGERDARALETLATVLAAGGRITEADAANVKAVEVAMAAGDRELAVQIAARRRAYRNAGQ